MQQGKEPVVAEYSGLASSYDRKWSFYIESTVRETLARLTPAPDAQMLDVGCGTGAMLRALADRYPRATLSGIDPVPAMLAVARQRLPAHVELYAGWAESLPFTDACFDVIVSNSAFHYFRQPSVALGEMRRVLRPGGTLVITDWCRDYLLCRIYDLYFGLFNRAHHKVYSEREFVRLVGKAGFRGIRSERYRISWQWGLMTVRASATG